MVCLHCWCTVHVDLQPCNTSYRYRTGHFAMARVAFVIAFLHYGCSAGSQSGCAPRRGLQLIQHKTKFHAKTMDNMASKGIQVYTFNIPTTTTTTVWPWAVNLLWDGHTCSPAAPWLGKTDTAEECAKLCHESPKQYTMTRIVWVKHGDKNCKCAADDCTPSEWQWGAVYSFYKTTTTTTSTTSTMTTTTTGGPTFQEGGAGCCRDSAGLSPAYSHERLFKRPIWDQSYGYYVSPPWSSLEELEESIQSNCLREPTCSGYQKLSCTTSWMEGGEWNPGFASECNVRYYCNSDFPNSLCNNLGDSGSANVVMGMPGMPECANTCMVQAPAPLSTTWTTTWAAVMTDAGAGTACVGGDPEAYLTMKDTFDLSYDRVVQLCLDDPNCHAIAFRTECEPVDYGSLVQESSASASSSSSSSGCCGCQGDWTEELRLYQMRYAYPGDGVTLSGNGVAPAKSEDGRTKDHVWQDYFRCYVKVQGTTPTTSTVSTATTAPTSSATTTTTTTASSFTIHLLWDGHTCSPATKWLGQTSTAEECAKLCHESPKQDTMTRIVWVKNGDKNCKCAADDCTPSEWQWGAVYSFSPTGTATTTTPTPTSTSTGDWILVQADSACRGANPSDNSVAYYVVILAASLEECQRQCSRNPRRCRGVEFNSTGRCEIWTRPNGIQSVATVAGFECYRNVQHPVFSDIISSFQGGPGTACRGDNTTDISPSHYRKGSAHSIENCQSQCESDATCKGINFNSAAHECLIWTHIIGATVPGTSDTCLSFV